MKRSLKRGACRSSDVDPRERFPATGDKEGDFLAHAAGTTETLVPGVYYDRSMFGAQMYVFGWCATIAGVRKDAQSAVSFELYMRAEFGRRRCDKPKSKGSVRQKKA